MFYRQPIIVFCLVLPLALSVLILGAGFLASGNITRSFGTKQQMFMKFTKDRNAANALEKEVKEERVHLQRWEKQLSQETASSIATTLREVMDKLPNKEIQQTAFERPSTVGGFGSASAQKSSMFRIAFRGTFRTLQKAILELETRMPQLQLQDIKIDPVGSQSNLINMQVTYTAWENETTRR